MVFRFFWGELRRRGVFRVCSVYMVAAWGASMGAAELFPAFGLSDSAFRWFVIIAALGVPVSACLAWFFDMTSAGIIKDQGPKSRAVLPAKDNFSETQIISNELPPVVEVNWQDERGRCRKQLSSDFLIGRGVECEISFDDPKVSRRHAKIYYAQGRWWIEDLQSSNGTRVDTKRITKMALPEECDICLSDTSPLVSLRLLFTSGETIVVAVNNQEETAT
ncbi:MAG: FHA domain-containing protein [Pseudomonadales bacterium]|nr:FHA domain-containing protein [Pseudomonadales bacterium]